MSTKANHCILSQAEPNLVHSLQSYFSSKICLCLSSIPTSSMLSVFPSGFLTKILYGIRTSSHLYYLFCYTRYCYCRYSALGPVWAETRAQSGDRYVSGRLHPGQILRGSLPLLSPAFRSSHFRYQVPPRPPRRERSQRRKVELVGENCPVIFA